MSTTAVPARSETRRARGERVSMLVRTPSVVFGAVVLLFWIVCAVLRDRITPYDPIFDQTPDLFQSPSSEYWFGTDRLGRDVFSRVIAGSRDILLVASAATLLAALIGTALGLVTGYLRRADDVVSRLLEAVLALPLIVVAITAITAVGTRSAWVVTLVIAIVFSPPIARTVRAAVLAEGSLDYVQAARLRGERAGYIMFQEILPNVMAPVVVEATVRLGYAMFTVAGLTFIGYGLQPPSPDWAVQVTDNYASIDPYWWPVLFPGLAIASLVVAVNLLADGIREVYER